MSYQSFNQSVFDALQEPMFLGQTVNVARYDQQRYPRFEQLIEKQLSFFWRPEEVDLSRDRRDYAALSPCEQHIFLSNLQYQTLLDSVQGRSPNMAFLPLVSLPELETWIETWAFSETVHSRSYTHIIRNIMTQPGPVFDDILTIAPILERAQAITEHYDQLIRMSQQYHLLSEAERPYFDMRPLKQTLYLTMVSVNILEAIRFYVSFACSFAFAEAGKMEGNAKLIKLIARDEALHLSGTEFILQRWQSGEDDTDMADIAEQMEPTVRQLFAEAAAQEKAWADYLFKDGSMIGLNADILHQYIDFLCQQRLAALNIKDHGPSLTNPLPWMDNWLTSEHVQVAPQEVEISSYLVGAIDSELNLDELQAMTL